MATQLQPQPQTRTSSANATKYASATVTTVPGVTTTKDTPTYRSSPASNKTQTLYQPQHSCLQPRSTAQTQTKLASPVPTETVTNNTITDKSEDDTAIKDDILHCGKITCPFAAPASIKTKNIISQIKSSIERAIQLEPSLQNEEWYDTYWKIWIGEGLFDSINNLDDLELITCWPRERNPSRTYYTILKNIETIIPSKYLHPPPKFHHNAPIIKISAAAASQITSPPTPHRIGTKAAPTATVSPSSPKDVKIETTATAPPSSNFDAKAAPRAKTPPHSNFDAKAAGTAKAHPSNIIHTGTPIRTTTIISPTLSPPNAFTARRKSPPPLSHKNTSPLLPSLTPINSTQPSYKLNSVTTCTAIAVNEGLRATQCKTASPSASTAALTVLPPPFPSPTSVIIIPSRNKNVHVNTRFSSLSSQKLQPQKITPSSQKEPTYKFYPPHKFISSPDPHRLNIDSDESDNDITKSTPSIIHTCAPNSAPSIRTLHASRPSMHFTNNFTFHPTNNENMVFDADDPSYNNSSDESAVFDTDDPPSSNDDYKSFDNDDDYESFDENDDDYDSDSD